MMILWMTFFCFLNALLEKGSNHEYSVSVPKTVEALEGSCVLIPCTFKVSKSGTELSPTGKVKAMWLKGKNKAEVFDKIEIYGDLHQKNCTSVLYNVQSEHAKAYYFRVEMPSPPFVATFNDGPFSLSVRDTPVSPQLSELSEVSEGTSVTLTCTAAAPCPSQPPTITWSPPSGNTHTHIQDEKNGNRSLVSFLNFIASRSHHGRQIYCTASYPRQSGSTVEANSTVQILRVQFSPVEVMVSVSPPGPAAEGSSVTLTCNSSEANPPVQSYTWFRGGQQAQRTPIASGQTLTFNLSSSDEELYYCRAEHTQGGKESAAVTLVIKGHFPLKVVVGGFLGGLLLCVFIWLALRLIKSKTSPQDEPCSQLQDSGACIYESVHTSTSKASEELQEQIHYGEIDFSKRPLRASSKMTGQEQGQESEYAEICPSGTVTDTESRYQKAPDTEELYAQVKRK